MTGMIGFLAGIGGLLTEYTWLEKAGQTIWIWLPLVAWLGAVVWPARTVRGKAIKSGLQLPLVIAACLGTTWIFVSYVVSHLETVVFNGQYAPIQILEGIHQGGKLSLLGYGASAAALVGTISLRVIEVIRRD